MQSLDIVIELLAYEGTASNCPSDATKITNRTQDTNIIGFTRHQLQIADATVDQSIEVPDPASEYLVVLTDQEITIKLNGGSEVVTLTPRVAGTKTFCYYIRGIVSGLLVSNASGSAANIDVIMANK